MNSLINLIKPPHWKQTPFNNGNGPSESHGIESQKRLVDVLLTEFFHSATLAAVFTSMVTTKAAGKPLKFVGPAIAYIPPEPMVFPAVVSGLTLSIDNPWLLGSLHEYYMRLTFGRSLSSSSATHRPATGDAFPADEHEFVDVWSQICTLALIVLNCSVEIACDRDPIYRYRVDKMLQLIRAARDAESPCVRADGTVFIPGWLERRSQERKTVGVTIWIESGGTRGQAFLRDISTGGMGLAGCSSFLTGSEISGQLQNGRRLVGIVTWSHNDRVGVRFLQPLSPNDPLLKPTASGNPAI